MALRADGSSDYYTKEQLAESQAQMAAHQARIAQLDQSIQAVSNTPYGFGLSNALTAERQSLMSQIQTLQAQTEGKGLNADGSMARKRFDSIADASGNMTGGYKLSDWEAISSDEAALKKMRETYLRDPGTDSLWAQIEKQKQGINQQNAMGAAARQSANALTSGQSLLAQTGGLSGAARERLAQRSSRDLLTSKQAVGRQGMTDLLNISSQDEQSRLSGLNGLQGFENNKADLAFRNQQAAKTAEQFNVGNALDEVRQKRAYDEGTYTEFNKNWAANKQADAQARTSSGGGGGCCFIFLEARYGNGAMDSVVRRFRDEHMTDRNKRGYYKMSEVLVPLMRKSKLVKVLVRTFMTDPLVAYGKAHYNEGSKLGFMFKPLTNFWLKTFDYLGEDHPFIRENGETI